MINGFSIFPHNNADFNKIMETWELIGKCFLKLSCYTIIVPNFVFQTYHSPEI